MKLKLGLNIKLMNMTITIDRFCRIDYQRFVDFENKRSNISRGIIKKNNPFYGR